MAIRYRHRADHGAIQLTDELTWQAAADLISAVDTLVDVYGYETIELVVSSPGGSTHAMNHVLEALHRRRAQGLRLRTRVVSHAQSAAAILVCAGDERVAEPGAQLLFHAVHGSAGHAVTAREASDLAGTLTRTDASVLDFLATRALATPSPWRAVGAEPGDRPVLETLSRACARRRRRPRTLPALARLVAECVDRAVERDDCAAIKRIYRRLLAADQAISAALALTLGLIDRVGVTLEGEVPPAAYPGPIVAEWARLFPPSGYVPRTVLTRHILALGESGAGMLAAA